MRLPSNRYTSPGQRPMNVRPRRRQQARPQRWRPKWSILLVPVAILLGAYVIAHVEPAFTWDDVMDALDIENRERYTMLMCLGLFIVGIVSIARVLRDHGKGKD